MFFSFLLLLILVAVTRLVQMSKLSASAKPFAFSATAKPFVPTFATAILPPAVHVELDSHAAAADPDAEDAVDHVENEIESELYDGDDVDDVDADQGYYGGEYDNGSGYYDDEYADDGYYDGNSDLFPPYDQQGVSYATYQRFLGMFVDPAYCTFRCVYDRCVCLHVFTP